jgi:tetratricopeptide (TPR) repeat protein
MSMLIDEGKLVLNGDRWEPTEDLSSMAVPPSIDALLAARLDRLPPSESGVVSPASVIGQRFPTSALIELVDQGLRSGLDSQLAALVHKDLVQAMADTGDDDGGVYRFQHLLVRDAAYRGLLKQTRAELHERFVNWAEIVNRERDREAEFEEIHGYHLEQAYRYWTELGPLSDHAAELGRRASRKLASAGERSFTRGDMPAALSLLTRAESLLPVTDPKRPRLLLMIAESELQLGEFVAAAEALSQAEALATSLGDRAAAATARVETLRLHYGTEAGVSSVDIVKEVEAARVELEELEDHEGLARAWRLLTNVEVAGMHWKGAEAAATETLAHARAAGSQVLEIRALEMRAATASYGPTPVPEAIELCESLLTRTRGDRRAEVFTRLQLARLMAMTGDFDEARAMCRRARDLYEEFGWSFQAAIVSLDSGPIELMAGDPEAAEAELRKDYGALSTMGESNYIATTAGLLAEALYRQGKLEEAAEFAEFAGNTAAEDDAAPQILWRQVEAKIRAGAGRADEADRLIGEAIEMTLQSDDVVDQGNALVDQAEVLVLTGRPDEAATALEEAIALYERKGNMVGAERAREQLAAAMVGEES